LILSFRKKGESQGTENKVSKLKLKDKKEEDDGD